MQAVGNNSAFITTMRVNVRTFESLFILFEMMWGSTTILRSNVNPNGAPQSAQRLLDAAGGLALVLH